MFSKIYWNPRCRCHLTLLLLNHVMSRKCTLTKLCLFPPNRWKDPLLGLTFLHLFPSPTFLPTVMDTLWFSADSWLPRARRGSTRAMAMITHSHSRQSLEEPEAPPGKKRSPRHNRLFHAGTVGSLCERGPGVKASCAAYLPLFFLPSLKWGDGVVGLKGEREGCGGVMGMASWEEGVMWALIRTREVRIHLHVAPLEQQWYVLLVCVTD